MTKPENSSNRRSKVGEQRINPRILRMAGGESGLRSGRTLHFPSPLTMGRVTTKYLFVNFWESLLIAPY